MKPYKIVKTNKEFLKAIREAQKDNPVIIVFDECKIGMSDFAIRLAIQSSRFLEEKEKSK